ncbi:MAG TPA: hypothetical protein VMB79_08620, partial [Jatrophihabitans sp.]|nr:hypothetical protein [Jatrophihabitans sp.]
LVELDAEADEPAELLLPVELVDRLIAGLAGQDGAVTITRAAGDLRFGCAGKEIAGIELALDFPDYRRLTARAAGVEVPVDVPALRTALASAPVATRTRENDGASYPLVVLAIAPDGVRVAADGDVGVNREFLLQALDAGDQLMLQLDGPTGPLTFRDPDRDGALSMLMPVRLD